MISNSKHSDSTKRKMRISAINRDNLKRIKSLPRGRGHWRWQSKPSKVAIHFRLYSKFGKAVNFPCADCGKPARDWSNEKKEYSANLNNYKPRCRSCHVKKDKNWVKK
jgi:hypothetical protein